MAAHNDNGGQSVIKLYKKEQDGKLLYVEYWHEEGQVVEHVGTVGTRGTTSRIDFPGIYSSEDEFRRDFMDKYHAKGYQAPWEDDGYMLIVQYPMKSMAGSKRDQWLKDKASEALQNELGWLGLGDVDGYDMGKTASPVPQYALNIYCFVIDEELGIQAVKRVLRESRLDYTQIKIASRRLEGDGDYILKYSAKKNELEFYI